MQHRQPRWSSYQYRAIALYWGVYGEQVIGNRGRQPVDCGNRVVPAILCGVPQSDSSPSGHQDVVIVLDEAAYDVVGQTGDEAALPPCPGTRVEGLEPCSRALTAHQPDVHRAVVLQDHPIHLRMQCRWSRREDSIGYVNRPQAASGSAEPDLLPVELHRVDDVLIGVVSELPSDGAIGQELPLQHRGGVVPGGA